MAVLRTVDGRFKDYSGWMKCQKNLMALLYLRWVRWMDVMAVLRLTMGGWIDVMAVLRTVDGWM